MSVSITYGDDVARQFANQIGAIGQGRARAPLARAVNRVTTMARTRVIRQVAVQSSIPRKILNRAIKRRGAQFRGSLPMEGVIYASGKPISLKHFKPRQMSYGVRVKIYGKMQRLEGTFMGPRPGVVAPALHGQVWQRTSAARLPIEMQYGPSIPAEMVKGESARAFEAVIASHLPTRVRHELGRLLPG